MYVLRKNGRKICQSRHLRTCAKQLNKIAGFRVVEPIRDYITNMKEYIDRVVWINYKEYTLIYEKGVLK